MFPIVHYYANMIVYGQVEPLMALGGLFPDLASGTGLTRDEGHQMGAAFFRWCTAEAPAMLPLARGIVSHGIMPYGVDYYADEYWPGCEKGWCFEQGKPWIERIAAVTRLPERFGWWKSHNFAEMSYELLTIEIFPAIGEKILAALSNNAVVEAAARALSLYTGKDSKRISDMFRLAPQIFSLEEVTPLSLAERQHDAFRYRHNVHNADVAGMAALLSEIKESLRPGYAPYMREMTGLVARMLREYD